MAEKVEIPVEGIIKLDANENPYGCSPRVKPALGTYPYFNIYPDAKQTELRKLLQGHTGVGAEHIVAGNGSDQLIDLVLRLFVGPRDEMINCVPTFDIFRLVPRCAMASRLPYNSAAPNNKGVGKRK